MTTKIWILVWLGLNATAEACRGPENETRTFFDKLPVTAVNHAVVAKIRIESSRRSDSKRYSTVQVTEGIKGVRAGEILTVESEIHSCNRDPELRSGGIYYIFGTIIAKVFRGTWRDCDSAIE